MQNLHIEIGEYLEEKTTFAIVCIMLIRAFVKTVKDENDNVRKNALVLNVTVVKCKTDGSFPLEIQLT